VEVSVLDEPNQSVVPQNLQLVSVQKTHVSNKLEIV
jgi:hypothetical protein